MVDMSPAARQRLNLIMDARRLDLGITWRELAVRSGVSYESLRTLRSGPGGMRPLMMRKLDAGLRWAPGSLEGVAAGADPEPLPLTHEGEADDASWKARVQAADEFLQNMTEQQRLELAEQFIAAIRSDADRDERQTGTEGGA